MRRGRRQQQSCALERRDLGHDPLACARRWLASAEACGEPLPQAMALATADARGRPSVRHVLLRGLDARGFVFYTNRASRKARELAANPRAALTLHWKKPERQICAVGTVERLPDAQSDAYFASRPRESQIGAWASPQSEVLPSRAALEKWRAEFEALFRGRTVPRPPHWGGYRLVPRAVEFWQGRPGRLHDRFVFRRDAARRAGWRVERLAP